MYSNRFHMMMVGSTDTSVIAKKLQNHSFVDLEFHQEHAQEK